MTDERKKLIAKIRALTARTVDNGCTEAEAVQAATMLASLIEKYNVDMTELEMRDSGIAERKMRYRGEVGHVMWFIADALESFAGIEYYQHARDDVSTYRIVYWGLPHEVEIAEYMMAVCHRALRNAFEEKLRESMLFVESKRRRICRHYVEAMARGLRHRLIQMAIKKTTTGNALVLVKTALSDEYKAKNGIEITQCAASHGPLSLAAFEGFLRSEKVNLSRGVSNGPAKARIL